MNKKKKEKETKHKTKQIRNQTEDRLPDRGMIPGSTKEEAKWQPTTRAVRKIEGQINKAP